MDESGIHNTDRNDQLQEATAGNSIFEGPVSTSEIHGADEIGQRDLCENSTFPIGCQSCPTQRTFNVDISDHILLRKLISNNKGFLAEV